MALGARDFECTDVSGAALFIDGPQRGKCPRPLKARVRFNAPAAVAIPYQLDCTLGHAWARSAQAHNTGPGAFIAVDAINFQIRRSGQLACALKSKLTGSTVLPAISLLGPDGAAIDMGSAASTGKKAFSIKNFVIPETGHYYIRVDNRDARASGTFKTSLKLKPAKRFSFDGNLSGPGDTDIVAIPLPAGTLSLKVGADGRIDPGSMLLEAPDGDLVSLAALGSLRSGEKRFVAYPVLGTEDDATFSDWVKAEPDNIKITYVAGYVTTDWDSVTIAAPATFAVPYDLEYAVGYIAAIM